MTAPRLEIVIDCADAERLATFWADALDYRRLGAAGAYVSLVPAEGVVAPKLILQAVSEPKTVKNRVHLDVLADDIEAEAARLVGLGATRVDDAPIAEHGTRWIRLADPEGNELCVCQA